mgnify:CR=1 FL=1
MNFIELMFLLTICNLVFTGNFVKHKGYPEAPPANEEANSVIFFGSSKKFKKFESTEKIDSKLPLLK